MQDRAQLMTSQAVADYTGIPLKTIYKYSSERTGPRSMRIGKRLLFRREDVDAWLDEHATAPLTGGAA